MLSTHTDLHPVAMHFLCILGMLHFPVGQKIYAKLLSKSLKSKWNYKITVSINKHGTQNSDKFKKVMVKVVP